MIAPTWTCHPIPDLYCHEIIVQFCAGFTTDSIVRISYRIGDMELDYGVDRALCHALNALIREVREAVYMNVCDARIIKIENDYRDQLVRR